jgi:ubiquinone biosynthesis protein UbiJ
LSCFSGDELELNGLTTLDKDSANELAYFSGKLILNGVKSLDKDSAQALSKFQGTAIELRGIESLDDDTHSILVADHRIITRR